jgi:hypothetical protein
MRKTRRMLVHLIECVEHRLHKPNRGICVELTLEGSRANVFKAQTRNMIEDNEAPRRCGEHIDDGGKRRMA